jgi:uncharacterized coiled-coil protein SlyX
LDDRIRQVCETQLAAPLHKSIQELSRKLFEMSEKYEAFRAEVDEVQEAMLTLQQQVQAAVTTDVGAERWHAAQSGGRTLTSTLSSVAKGDLSTAPQGPDSPSMVELPPRPKVRGSDCASAATVDGPVAGVRHSPGTWHSQEKVSELLEKLKGIAPKIIEHEKAIEQFRSGPKEALSAMRDELRGLRCRMEDVEVKLRQGGGAGENYQCRQGW